MTVVKGNKLMNPSKKGFETIKQQRFSANSIYKKNGEEVLTAMNELKYFHKVKIRYCTRTTVDVELYMKPFR